MKTDWIKMTDRAPTEADLPVWAWFAYDKECRGPYLFDEQLCMDGVTHWRPAKDDVPEPPREETQAEKDDVGFHAWYRDDGTVECGAHMTTWHAALAYEREQVAKMLPATPHDSAKAMWPKTSLEYHIQAIEAIRARCGGGQGK